MLYIMLVKCTQIPGENASNEGGGTAKLAV